MLMSRMQALLQAARVRAWDSGHEVGGEVDPAQLRHLLVTTKPDPAIELG